MNFSNLKKDGIMGWLKPIGAACVIAAAAFPGFAADTSELCLKVELRNGQTDEFLLAEKPEVTFNGESCVISCGGVDASYDMADILKAYFKEGTNSVEENLAVGISVDLTDPTSAVIGGLTPGAPVTLYGVDGTVFLTVTADSDGVARISLDGLASGSVYVVSVNSTKNFKLYKK